MPRQRYNPWDQGTFPDPQKRTDAQRLAALNKAVDSDGFNGDTVRVMPLLLLRMLLRCSAVTLLP